MKKRHFAKILQKLEVLLSVSYKIELSHCFEQLIIIVSDESLGFCKTTIIQYWLLVRFLSFLFLVKVCSFWSCAFLALCSSEHTCARESIFFILPRNINFFLQRLIFPLMYFTKSRGFTLYNVCGEGGGGGGGGGA